MSGTINNKDQKILWARAAGLCAMPDCRKKLTFDKSEQSGSITLGEMCHIVGEKNSSKSARGISKLPLANRNEYSNLILLCAHHHIVIDKNEAAWPVELLHKIKVDHELWVEESLSAAPLTPEMIVYSTIIDGLNLHLRLDSFNWFMSNAIKSIIHRDFIEACNYVDERLLAIDWPGSNLALETTIINLMTCYAEYIEHYLKYALIDDLAYEYYREDKSYKRIYPNPNYHIISERNMLWERKNFILLRQFVYYLNQFVKSVRMHYNPLFHLKRGKFLVIDEFGLYNGGTPYKMLPEKESIEADLVFVNKEIEEYESKHKNWC